MKKIDYRSQHFEEMNHIDLVNLNGGGFLTWILANLAWEVLKNEITKSPIREGEMPELEMSGGYYVMPSDNA